MKLLLTLGCIAALIGVAACNQSPQEAPQPETAPEAARNVANGSADAADIAAVMRARHEHYEEMGKAMKGIGNELKASSPSVETIQRHSAVIAGYGPQVLEWFPQGSGPEAGRTRAKAEIWADPETFRQRARAFQTEAAEFRQAAAGGDIAAIRAAQAELGETCKNCHDRFRGPELDD